MIDSLTIETPYVPLQLTESQFLAEMNEKIASTDTFNNLTDRFLDPNTLHMYQQLGLLSPPRPNGTYGGRHYSQLLGIKMMQVRCQKSSN